MAPEQRGPVAVTGATGFIGSALVDSLRGDGYDVLRLTRGTVDRGAGEIGWDPATGQIDSEGLTGTRAVVHLAGESLDGRWTDSQKRRIRESRVAGTRLLAEALASLPEPPEVLVSGSAVGYYGVDRGDEPLDETSAPGTDFLSRVTVEWEAAAEPAAGAGIRVVHPRFGMVLDSTGGALARMLPVFKLGVGGRLGSGRQWMSWVSREDAVRAIRFLIDTPALAGPVNVTAPQPVTNATFTEELGRALRRPAILVVPGFALRLAFGEMADAMVLASLKAFPERLLEAGFEFRHPGIDQAFATIIRSDG
jgi:uncharacterized protein (TIGR01777 family)